MEKKLIRFDWAIKKLLKDRMNFDILEGFLTVVLGETIIIQEILDGEGAKETENDKHNRVDVLVKNQKGEFIIIEIQNSKEYDYFHRMIYGTSKVISEYITQGQPYSYIKKVISITIAYFDLGQGDDYVYHGTNKFHGIHKNDVLLLADKQRELYDKQTVYEIFPEYWVIKAEKFNNQVDDKLDEWIYFLKNSEIKAEFTAPGLKEAREKLDQLRMSEEERRVYNRYLRHLMDLASKKETDEVDLKDRMEKMRKKILKEGIEQGIEQGMDKRNTEVVLRMDSKGMAVDEIAEFTGLSLEKVQEILNTNQ